MGLYMSGVVRTDQQLEMVSYENKLLRYYYYYNYTSSFVFLRLLKGLHMETNFM